MNRARLFLPVLFALACGTLHADLHLTLSRSRTTVTADTGDRKATAEQISVVLGRDYFWIDLQDYRRIYDFAKERMYTLHLDSRTYLDDSLHALVAYREVEMRSRLGVGPFAPIENLTVSPGKQLEVSSLFGMKLDGMTVPEPTEEVQGPVRRFLYQGEPIAEYDMDERPLPADLQRSFRRFLAYECGMHPTVRERLCSNGKLFKRLQVVARMDDAMRVTDVTLGDASEAPAAERLVPQDMRLGPEPGNNDPILQVVCSVLNGTAERRKITADDLRRLVGEAIQQKQFAQAMVYYLHNMLRFGVEDVELLRKVSDAAGNDQGFILINVAVRSGNKAEGERALLALDALDTSKLKDGYVLDVYRADALSAAGRVSESQWTLVSLIRKDPYLAGAYKDLGGILFAAFDMPGAWRCWELCLKLCPGYSLLSRFQSYQDMRKKRHPDFF